MVPKFRRHDYVALEPAEFRSGRFDNNRRIVCPVEAFDWIPTRPQIQGHKGQLLWTVRNDDREQSDCSTGRDGTELAGPFRCDDQLAIKGTKAGA